MSISTRFSADKKVYTISIEGDFEFSRLNEFRKAYTDEHNENEIQSAKIVIDLDKTNTIDSSALGMMLNMQKTLNKADREISIINSNDIVAKILHITNFEKKFNVE